MYECICERQSVKRTRKWAQGLQNGKACSAGLENISPMNQCRRFFFFFFIEAMPFFRRTVASSTTTSSSLSLPSTPSVGDGGGGGNNVQSRAKRLTRQRRIRHLGDPDLGFQLFLERSDYTAVSSPRESPSGPGGSAYGFPSVVPRPLPLPESALTMIPDSSTSKLEEFHSSTTNEELRCSAFRKNGTNQDATKSANRSTYCCRRSSQDASLRLSLPARSAPTSGFSSPAISPQRSSISELHSIISSNLAKSRSNYCRRLSLDVNAKIADYKFDWIAYSKSDPTTGLSSPAVRQQGSHIAELSKSLVTPQESKICSALEVADLGRIIASHGYQVPSAKSAHSPNVSPFDNLTEQSSHSRPRWPSKLSFPLNHELLAGSPRERPDCNSHVSAHPLPLPPGAAPSQPCMSSPLAILHNETERPNTLPKKTYWKKGKLIGRGTYGSVYVGTNRDTGALCAMKEIYVGPDDPKSAECIKQLEQEIRFLRNLKHPNIVKYYGSEMVDDHFYLFMEYVHPGSVNKYVKEHCRDMTESIVRNFTRHILSGLAYLHGTETIHRDIKGANLLVDSSGVVKLADFGVAKHLTGMSYDLSLKGSPHWMAPEVIKSAMQKDASPNLALGIDIWSLGCTVIEMFTGKPPWGELQGPQAMFKVLHKVPDIPENLSPEGKDFLSCCFQRNPAERPPAIVLLEHPFTRNSSDANVSACRLDQSPLCLMDIIQRSRDYPACKTQSMPASPDIAYY